MVVIGQFPAPATVTNILCALNPVPDADPFILAVIISITVIVRTVLPSPSLMLSVPWTIPEKKWSHISWPPWLSSFPVPSTLPLPDEQSP